MQRQSLSERNIACKDSNDSLHIPSATVVAGIQPARWADPSAHRCMARVRSTEGEPVDLLFAAAVDPNPHRQSLIEDVQHGVFVRELA